MQLNRVLANLDYKLIKGSLNKEISMITSDSRQVIDDSVFICIQGFLQDGHKYIHNAIEKGANTIVLQNEVEIEPFDGTIILVEDTRKAMAAMASNYYEAPSKELNLIGVTGTNGKTTTAFMIEAILKHNQHKTGLIGTIENHIGERRIETPRTTPESTELQALFCEMKQEEVQSVVMEVSSHALDLHRVYTADFDVAVFTNLTQDHLDFHGTMGNYLKAKTKLFKMSQKGVVNLDDRAAEYIMDNATTEELITYGIEDEEADLLASHVEIQPAYTTYTLNYKNESYPIKLLMTGKFNVYNSLAAIGACLSLGIDIELIINALTSMSGVKGRFQAIHSSKGFSVIVDYAHAPDGLSNVLDTIKEFAKGRIITVFGCGGDRDRTKRPIMGQIAGEKSDYCIITSDNPRTEEPALIIKDVEEGIIKTSCPYTTIVSRLEGIHHALEMAHPSDIVLIAGKGHEDYQEVHGIKTHFDDVLVVKDYLQEA